MGLQRQRARPVHGGPPSEVFQQPARPARKVARDPQAPLQCVDGHCIKRAPRRHRSADARRLSTADQDAVTRLLDEGTDVLARILPALPHAHQLRGLAGRGKPIESTFSFVAGQACTRRTATEGAPLRNRIHATSARAARISGGVEGAMFW